MPFAPTLRTAGQQSDRPVELYLVTDGRATLTLKPQGFSGRARYRPTGRITGGVTQQPGSCPTMGCEPRDGYKSHARFGGQTVNLGRGGFAASYAYVSARAEDDPLGPAARGIQLSMHILPCVEPNLANPRGSTRPGPPVGL